VFKSAHYSKALFRYKYLSLSLYSDIIVGTFKGSYSGKSVGEQ